MTNPAPPTTVPTPSEPAATANTTPGSPATGTDGGRLTYADPTGNTAAANVDAERRDEKAGAKAGAEAAKYRAQLRDVEAERDGLRDQLAAFQRQSIDALAGAAGIKPAALWASGVELASLVGEDGAVNTEAVTSAVDAARESLGLATPTASASAAGITSGAGPAAAAEPTWAGITRPQAA